MSPAVRPLGLAGRMAVLGLVVLGAIVATPSGMGLLLFLPYAAVGGILAVRRPRTSIGWLLLGMAWSFAPVNITFDATVQQFADGTISGLVAVFAVMWNMSGGVGFLLFGVLALVFPTGRLPAGPWGKVTRFALGACLVLLAATFVMPNIRVQLIDIPETVLVRNPIAVLPDLAIWQVIMPVTATYVPIMLVLVISAISLVVRTRRAIGVERQQLRWFAASIAATVIAIVGGMGVSFIVPSLGASGLAWIPAEVAFAVVPIAVGIAVLRYRLYEIDRIISRTLSWTLVSGVLIMTFAAGVIALQAVLEGFTQGETLAVAGSTLIALALFQPLRRRVQMAVDRRFDRARYDGQKVVDAFGRRLRDEVDLDRLRTSLLATADDVVRPVSASIWLRSGDVTR